MRASVYETVSRTFARISLALVVLSSGVRAVAAATTPPAPLKTVGEIRHLSQEQAAGARPVVLRGVVTVLSGWHTSFFLQDSTAGISVDREFADPAVKQGELVEVLGVTGPGKFAPVVKATSIKVLGHAVLPAPKLPSYAELFSGNEDGQWIGVTGLVRSAEIKTIWNQPRLVLTLDTGGGAVITARVHDDDPASIGKYDGAIVSIRGVCGTVFNDRRQFIGARMFVAGPQDIHIDRPAMADPFSIPLRSFDTLLQFREDNLFHQHVRVQGTVTWSKPGDGLYLMNGNQGLFVQTEDAGDLPVGSSVEAVGYPSVGQYSPRLENAIVRKVQTTRQWKPQLHRAGEMIVTKDGFASAPFDATLVTIRGRLVEEVPNGKDELLLMQDGDLFFTARLTRAGSVHTHFDDDSVLQLTGVCVATANQWRDAQTFSLLLRDNNDIVVLKNPPWWNARHATWLFSILLLGVVGVFVVQAVTRHNAHLHELAVTDPLTGLYNRRGFLMLAQRHLESMLKQKCTLLLFYIDVDRFKEINDTFGHEEGDRALQSVTALLQKTFRKSDIIGRLGGDEFAVATVIDSPGSESGVQERLQEAVRNLNALQAHPYTLQLSIGTVSSSAGPSRLGIEDLLSVADAKMYRVKRRGHAEAESIHAPERGAVGKMPDAAANEIEHEEEHISC